MAKYESGKMCILTVLTPTYNRCQLLPKLYESLRRQTNQRFQWLVIDDGSTDGTEEYMKFLQGGVWNLN